MTFFTLLLYILWITLVLGSYATSGQMPRKRKNANGLVSRITEQSQVYGKHLTISGSSVRSSFIHTIGNLIITVLMFKKSLTSFKYYRNSSGYITAVQGVPVHMLNWMSETYGFRYAYRLIADVTFLMLNFSSLHGN